MTAHRLSTDAHGLERTTDATLPGAVAKHGSEVGRNRPRHASSEFGDQQLAESVINEEAAPALLLPGTGPGRQRVRVLRTELHAIAPGGVERVLITLERLDAE